MSQKYEGNLLGLWKQLQTIYNGKQESEQEVQDFIQTEKLDGFLEHWFEPENGFDCNENLCGTTCDYCKRFYEKLKA